MGHERQVKAAVGIVDGGDDGERGEAGEKAGGDRFFAEEAAKDQREQNATKEFGSHKNPATLEELSRGIKLNGGAQENLKNGEDGSGASEKGAGEGAEKSGQSREAIREETTQQEWDDHEAAGQPFDGGFEFQPGAGSAGGSGGGGLV